MKAALLPCVGHPDRALRSTVASIAAGLIASAPAGWAEWPELLAALVHCLEASADQAAQEAGLACLVMLCEDVPAQMDAPLPWPPAAAGSGAPTGMASPGALLVPALLSLMGSPHSACRRSAVACLNQLLGYPPASLLERLEVRAPESVFPKNGAEGSPI